ncbi:unnamed protein product [Rotaria sordida]|uniref:Uncharacterized protein n=2 Tax=Rotaria sordida TaxID=392033 RepID=A0A819UMV0_9BILA|nr:unnamed protein product [Rotaria sordida]
MFIKNVWLPYRNYHKTTPSNDDSTANVQPVVNSSENEHVYRMPEKMRTLLDYFKSYFQFYRFYLEQTSSSTITST